MTAQAREKIVIDGKETSMTSTPEIPENNPGILKVPQQYITSDCWRGYVGAWEIKNGRLYLIGISGKYNLRENTPIFANWYTGTLAVSEGSIINQINNGYTFVYEKDVNIKIKNGFVVLIKTIDNRQKLKNIESQKTNNENDLKTSLIKKFVATQGIEDIVHFTRIENIPSILKNGLYGRKSLSEVGVGIIINDRHRFDYLPDAICCSISFPNYKMFYQLRKDNPGTDWAVLRIKSQILWEKNCVFCIQNAAKRSVALTKLQHRKGLEALQLLFADIDAAPSRKDLNIPNYYPTHPQAEVLILDRIEPEMILDISLDQKERIRDHKKVMEIVESCNGEKEFFYNKHYFDARKDYANWRGAQIG